MSVTSHHGPLVLPDSDAPHGQRTLALVAGRLTARAAGDPGDPSDAAEAGTVTSTATEGLLESPREADATADLAAIASDAARLWSELPDAPASVHAVSAAAERARLTPARLMAALDALTRAGLVEGGPRGVIRLTP